MVSINDEGREMVQGMFSVNQCFGEPPLILNRVYPASAIVVQDAVILRLQRERFLQILKENTDAAQFVIQCLAGRIYDKAITNQFLICQHPEDRILLLLKKMALNGNLLHDGMVPYTRQQLADFTGLRVETVIRAISKLHQMDKIAIKEHRVYYSQEA
jgi:CRP/FNR family transcriptional regulator